MAQLEKVLVVYHLAMYHLEVAHLEVDYMVYAHTHQL